MAEPLNPTERALTRRQVAAVLGVSFNTVRRLEAAGKLPQPVQVAPHRVVHLESDIVAYLRNAPRGPSPHRPPPQPR